MGFLLMPLGAYFSNMDYVPIKGSHLQISTSPKAESGEAGEEAAAVATEAGHWGVRTREGQHLSDLVKAHDLTMDRFTAQCEGSFHTSI